MVVSKAAICSLARVKRDSIFPDIIMGSMMPRKKNYKLYFDEITLTDFTAKLFCCFFVVFFFFCYCCFVVVIVVVVVVVLFYFLVW